MSQVLEEVEHDTSQTLALEDKEGHQLLSMKNVLWKPMKLILQFLLQSLKLFQPLKMTGIGKLITKRYHSKNKLEGKYKL